MTSQVPRSSQARTSGWASWTRRWCLEQEAETSYLFSRTPRTPTTTRVIILPWSRSSAPTTTRVVILPRSRSSSRYQKRTPWRMIQLMRTPPTLLPPLTRVITWLVVEPTRVDFRLRTPVPRRQRRLPWISRQRVPPHTRDPPAGAPGRPGSSRNPWFHPPHRTLTWSGGSRLPSRGHTPPWPRCPSTRDPATCRSRDERPATAATWAAWVPRARAHRALGAQAAPTRTSPCRLRRRSPTEGGNPDSVSIAQQV